jgi:hypothetical protein
VRRVAGYWLLYAVVGVLVLLMLLGGGGDMAEDTRSPIRTQTKILGAASGLLAGVAVLGGLATTPAGRWLLWLGAPSALIATVWSWVAIARDLRARG